MMAIHCRHSLPISSTAAGDGELGPGKTLGWVPHQSLEPTGEPTEWVDEAQRRHEAMLREGDPGLPADDVLDELAASLA